MYPSEIWYVIIPGLLDFLVYGFREFNDFGVKEDEPECSYTRVTREDNREESDEDRGHPSNVFRLVPFVPRKREKER